MRDWDIMLDIASRRVFQMDYRELNDLQKEYVNDDLNGFHNEYSKRDERS
jgi:hypothetical protein